MTLKRWTIYDNLKQEYLPDRYILKSSAQKDMNNLIRKRAMDFAVDSIKNNTKLIPAYTTYKLVELA